MSTISTKIFTKGSRFLKNGKLFTDSNQNIKVWYDKPKIQPSSTDETVTVEPGEEWNPNAIASRVYGGQYKLGWVIMNANNLFHVREIIVGKVLRIPTLLRINGVWV